MFLENKEDEVLRSAESILKRENAGTGIDILVMSFYGKTYKSGNQFFMRERESKDKIDSFMIVENDVIFTQISAYAGIKKFGKKEVAATVQEYRQIYKDTMEGKTVVTPIDPDMLS